MLLISKDRVERGVATIGAWLPVRFRNVVAKPGRRAAMEEQPDDHDGGAAGLVLYSLLVLMKIVAGVRLGAQDDVRDTQDSSSTSTIEVAAD